MFTTDARLLSYHLEPKTDDQKGEEKEDDKENISPILKALQIPGVILIGACYVMEKTKTMGI